jgi:hypothetical protein
VRSEVKSFVEEFPEPSLPSICGSEPNKKSFDWNGLAKSFLKSETYFSRVMYLWTEFKAVALEIS